MLETVGRRDEYQPIFMRALEMYNPGAVQDRKYMLFAEKEDDDESDAGKNIKPTSRRRKQASNAQRSRGKRRTEKKEGGLARRSHSLRGRWHAGPIFRRTVLAALRIDGRPHRWALSYNLLAHRSPRSRLLLTAENYNDVVANAR